VSTKVHASEITLRIGIALVRSELEQRRSPLIILGHTLSTKVVHESKLALRQGMTLVRCKLE
jgi:hypothetical protein